MSKGRILIFDDDARSRERWREDLDAIKSVHESFVVESMQGDDFKLLIDELKRRRLAAKRAKKLAQSAWSTIALDDVEILAVDYDLFKLDELNFITGEDVAYLARCYSRCRLIIGLNQYRPANNFDLTLRGHPESYADLNISDRQLTNTGLWKEPWEGFRPWYWPLLPQLVKAFEQRVEELTGRLDESILSFLKFPEKVIGTLPRHVLQFIEANGKRSQATTFRDFVLSSSNGLRGRDKPIDDEAIARIAAARLTKWLERVMLSGQDILVDAPYLVSRYATLLKGDGSSVGNWNKTASFAGVNRVGLDHKRIEAFRFECDNWLSRPAWFWSPISAFEEIPEVAEPWSKIERPDLVFCEDLSRFLPRSATREFVADLPSSPFVRRFVVDKRAKGLKRIVESVREVEYYPAVRFSL